MTPTDAAGRAVRGWRSRLRRTKTPAPNAREAGGVHGLGGRDLGSAGDVLCSQIRFRCGSSRSTRRLISAPTGSSASARQTLESAPRLCRADRGRLVGARLGSGASGLLTIGCRHLAHRDVALGDDAMQARYPTNTGRWRFDVHHSPPRVAVTVRGTHTPTDGALGSPAITVNGVRSTTLAIGLAMVSP